MVVLRIVKAITSPKKQAAGGKQTCEHKENELDIHMAIKQGE